MRMWEREKRYKPGISTWFSFHMGLCFFNFQWCCIKELSLSCRSGLIVAMVFRWLPPQNRSFMEHALSEVERFKKQKGADLKELFISYAVLQIKMAKRVSGGSLRNSNQLSWTHFDNMRGAACKGSHALPHRKNMEWATLVTYSGRLWLLRLSLLCHIFFMLLFSCNALHLFRSLPIVSTSYTLWNKHYFYKKVPLLQKLDY